MGSSWHRSRIFLRLITCLIVQQAGRIPSGPSGRYGVTLNHYKGKLYMFGGTDGGTSKHGRDG